MRRCTQINNAAEKLFQSPGAVGEVGEETGVAEDLELLADFVADVAVVGMEFFQLAGVGVNVFVGEFGFAKTMDEV